MCNYVPTTTAKVPVVDKRDAFWSDTTRSLLKSVAVCGVALALVRLDIAGLTVVQADIRSVAGSGLCVPSRSRQVWGACGRLILQL